VEEPELDAGGCRRASHVPDLGINELTAGVAGQPPGVFQQDRRGGHVDAVADVRSAVGEAVEDVPPLDRAVLQDAGVAGGQAGVGGDGGVERADLADVDDAAGAERGQAGHDAAGDVAPDAVLVAQVKHAPPVVLGALPGVPVARHPGGGVGEVPQAPAEDDEVVA